jgi:hypothetical protein
MHLQLIIKLHSTLYNNLNMTSMLIKTMNISGLSSWDGIGDDTSNT